MKKPRPLADLRKAIQEHEIGKCGHITGLDLLAIMMLLDEVVGAMQSLDSSMKRISNDLDQHLNE